MPRLQSHQPHHSSQHLHPSPAKPTPPRPKVTQTTKTNKTIKLFATPPPKNSPLTPLRSSTPTPHQHLKPTKSTKKKYAASPSKNRDAISLISFCDHLSHELYSKPSSIRKPKKHSSNFHALISPHSSDNEEVHAIYLPLTNYSSRSTTPTPTKTSHLDPFDNPDPSFTLPLDESSPIPLPAERTSIPSKPLPNCSTQSFPPTRRHIRAKSVASIFECTSTARGQPAGVKDDWDMPTVIPPQDLTWQQKEKSRIQSCSPSHSTSNLVQRDSLKSSTRSMVNQSLQEVPPRQLKSTLARTSSAGTIKRIPPTSDKSAKPQLPHSSRSDDESALTWQQSIIRPLPKTKPLPVTCDPPLNSSEFNPSVSKKNLGTSGAHKTPVKPSPRKTGVHSVVQAKPSPLLPSSKRRNSLSASHTAQPRNQPDLLLDQVESISSLMRSKAGQDALSWQPFSSRALVNHHPGLPPLSTDPLPIVGAQVDFTPPRRHTKSYTHQPVTLSHRRPTQPSSNQTIVSPSSLSNMPESYRHQGMITPSKSRSTSEDLNLASPDKQLTTPALRAAFMYAGPQFHNSPCPAALPAPKFSFGSA